MTTQSLTVPELPTTYGLVKIKENYILITHSYLETLDLVCLVWELLSGGLVDCRVMPFSMAQNNNASFKLSTIFS